MRPAHSARLTQIPVRPPALSGQVGRLELPLPLPYFYQQYVLGLHGINSNHKLSNSLYERNY